ncbi:GNAT family N-acetyltransferase [Mesorhizobium sp. RP14(2022)]|uniref:GNAT family N-acetyltransferase n=1 Tax=Mesorhizobium liriopis TaxID=2953882 RepID=A0ABT1CE47_9HYPH|nr:GNAT family protein [Mesorhizobium liriopis]MCO6052236.1 GNAT family N-acetyltransferase [Mesorhizobium liriopis]
MPAIEWTTPNFIQKSLGPGSDLSAMQSWLADAELMRSLNLPARHLDLNQLARYAATFDNERKYLIGIYEKAQMRLIGYRILELNPAHRRANLHLLIAEEQYRSRRATDETQVPFYDFVFGTLKVNKLVAEIAAFNERTIRRAESSGYRFEARLERELLSHDGTTFVDQVRMALFAEDWATARIKTLERLASH